MTADIHQILKRYWGYASFRERQEEIIRSVMSGRDTVGLLPTGGGKSITFQVPALAMEGVAIVVTPLISLMKDQVDGLQERGIRATYLYSGLAPAKARLAMDHCAHGKMKLLYVSPERLRSERFIERVRQWHVSMIVVDEAHCISQWGYDFRPSYLEINRLRAVLPSVPILALTASATPEVLDDIIRQLGLRQPAVLRRSFARENISYIVRPDADKMGQLVHILQHTSGPAIVYVRSRKKTSETAIALQSQGISAAAYHAGMDAEVKMAVQESWMDGQKRVIVATTAFGMGIDKPDVRLVAHLDLPSSLEEYYQEAGRAGRDGAHSYAVCITNARDRATLARRLSSAFPPREKVAEIYDRLCVYFSIPMGEGRGALYQIDVQDFSRRYGYDEGQVRAALAILTQARYIEFIEEVRTQSRVQVIARKDQLYNLPCSADADEALMSLLRGYTGLFADLCEVSEPHISRQIGMSSQRLYEALLELARMHIIRYIPRSATPMVAMVQERQEGRHLVIPKAVYEERRERMRLRLQAMQRFAFATDECRANIVLRYFGEQPQCDCGHCDVCRGRRQAGRGDKYGRAEQYVRQMCPPGAYCNLQTLLALAPVRRDEVIAAVRALADAGHIRVEGDKIIG